MMVLLPSAMLVLLSVARAAGPRPAAMLVPAWALARVLSAARTAELPPLVLVAARAPALAVLLPMTPGL
ncbi:MAG: hypothetical protein WB902_08760 [Acetobacteraceae bacterium]|jgi:hypothetical protein